MASGARLLFVTEKFPWPVDDGGQSRTYHVLASLARALPTTLIALAPPDPACVAPIEALGVEVAVVGTRAPRWSVPLHAGLATFTRAPHPIGKNRSRAMLREIERRCAEGGVAALHFNHLDTAQYVERLRSGRARVHCTFDTHNVLSTMYRRFEETAPNPLARAWMHLQWMKMNRYERAVMKEMDLVCVCSDLERDLLRTWGVERVLVVPNGVDTDAFAPAPDAFESARRRDPPLVVFTGAMGYAPNADAARWFLDAILPRIRAELPRVLFRIVGKDPPADLAARARPDEIEVTGRVEDVRPCMRDASVFVCPLRVGGGTRLKILDALALGLPVVSTTVGAEGLHVTQHHDVALADEPREFAERVLELLRDERRARSLAEHGRELVVARYGWEGVTRPLVERVLQRAAR